MNNRCSFLALIVFVWSVMSAHAATTYTETIDGITWTYTISNGKASVGGGSQSKPAVPKTTEGAIVIPSSLGGYSVTRIEHYAFYECSALTTVTIPNGVTSVGRYAFSACSKLTSIVVPASIALIDECAFRGSSNVQDVSISDLDSWCRISFSNDTSNPLSSGGRVLLNGEELSGGIVIPQDVSIIAPYLFSGCSSITSVLIPNGVTAIGNYAFNGCSSLSSISFPTGLLSIGKGSFSDCSGLISLALPEGITTISQGAFSGCLRLFSVSIPTSITTIETGAFRDCTGLAEVHISDLSSWCGINSPVSLYIGSSYSNPLVYAHHLFLNGIEIRNLVIPNTVTTIGDGAFEGCTGLRSVVIPDSVNSVGAAAFRDCNQMDSVDMGNGVETIGACAFEYCTKLSSILFSERLRTIDDYAFYECYKSPRLTSITLPDSLLSIGRHAFAYNKKLTKVLFGNGLKSIGYGAFQSCELLDNIEFPDSLEEISERAFQSCESLSCVRFGLGASTIGDAAFSSCSALGSIYVPINIRGIGDEAFSRSNLSVIYLPEALRDTTYAYGLPSGCRIVYHNGSFDLDVASAMGTPVPAVGTTAFEPGQMVTCAVQRVLADPDHENVTYGCYGWTGTGSVPSSGTGTNVSFVIEMNSSITWNWRTNVNVFADGKPLDWSYGGDADWTASLGGADAGHEDCLRSGTVPQGGRSILEATVVGPGTLSFDWKISANRGDYGRFLIDGATNASATRATSWATVTTQIPSGSHTVRWVYERNSTEPSGDDGLFLDNVVWRPVLTLGVTSAYGTPTPAAGTAQYGFNETVSARVAVPAAANGTRRVCTGWTGTGSVPASGSGTNVTFAITESSTIRWNWRTDYWIALSSSGPVTPNFSSSWIQSGKTVTVTWPDPGAATVVRVSGDTTGTTFDEVARTLTIPADGPRSITLTAATLTLADAVDAPALVWSTGALNPWAPQTSTTKDGEDAAMSAGIDGGETSALETTVAGSGTLSWSWKLDRGEVAGIDLLVDGTLAESIDASGGWVDASLAIQGDGGHCIRFEYWNESGSAANRGYIDCVSWTGGASSESVWYVDAATGDDSNGGRSPETALKTIQAAFDIAETGGNIVVADGVYTGSADAYSAIRNTKNKTLSFRSVNGAQRTIIDGGGCRRCVEGATKQDGQTSYIHETYRHLVTMDGFTFRNGNCRFGGGAVLTATLRNCIVTGNTTRRRGAVTEVNLDNCLIVGNAAWNDTTESSAPSAATRCSLVNCTVVANTNMTRLGAVAVGNSTVKNCIIVGNTFSNELVAAEVDGTSSTVFHSCLDSPTEGTGNIVAAPCFVDPATGDYRLRDDSPCIDAGDDSCVTTQTDLDGKARIYGAHVDLGAFENDSVFALAVKDVEVVFDGQAHSLDATASCPGGTAILCYALADSGPWSDSAPSFTNAGTNEVWVVATAEGQEPITNLAKVVILPKPLEASMACVVPDQVYDGTPKTPELHIRDGWPDILSPEDYTIRYKGNVDVGTARIFVTGRRNYTGTIELPFGIDAVDPERYLVVDLSGGTNATAFPISYLADVPAGGWTDEYKTTKLVLRKVPAGSFNMGSPETEVGRGDNETLHRVTLTRGFYVGVFETTQKQWELVMGDNPSQYPADNHPVERASYNDIRGSSAGAAFPVNNAVDADSFLGILRAKTGAEGFDLPTEAQWEYSCRARMDSALNNGKELEAATGTSANLAEVGRYPGNRGGGQHAVVGSYLPNRWELYDLHGNVGEWCLDWRNEYPAGPVLNPLGEPSGTSRSYRGGSWKVEASRARAARRGGLSARDKYNDLGFRLVCDGLVPTIWYVDGTSGTDSNDGLSWTTAFHSIQQAVDVSIAGNTILVTNGVYAPISAANAGVTIRSVNGARVTIIDGGGTTRCALLGYETNDTVKTMLVGFTLTNGFATESDSHGGGAMGGVLNNCIIQGNSCWPRISPETGLYGRGGGLYSSIAHHCQIIGNDSANDGGGAYYCMLYDCLVADNTAANKGGDNSGGGIMKCLADRCTIANNCAGKGSSSVPGGAGADSSILTSCIVFGNAYTSGSDNDAFYSKSAYSCFGSAVSGIGNIVANPLFVDASNGDYRLREDSPCIDAGNSTNSMFAVDLAGNPRVKGRAIDMGCYEYQTVQTETWTTPVPVPFVWLDNYPVPLAKHSGDYEAFANDDASNGENKVWQCYVAGLDPTNATSHLLAAIDMLNGEPVVSWMPDLNEGGTKHERVYTVEGKTNLTDKSWGPTNEATRFFRVKVSMPE